MKPACRRLRPTAYAAYYRPPWPPFNVKRLLAWCPETTFFGPASRPTSRSQEHPETKTQSNPTAGDNEPARLPRWLNNGRVEQGDGWNVGGAEEGTRASLRL